MTDITPSDLLALDKEGISILDVVALDTETSGLYVDDGARVSAVSLAWQDPNGDWLESSDHYDNLTWKTEEVAPGKLVNIVSIAWPFDQGTDGKPEDTNQRTLWADAENLDRKEWICLLNLVSGFDLVMHNAKFDIEMMEAGCRRWPGYGVNLIENVVWDSQNVNHYLWPLERTSLKPTCARIFGKEFEDESKKVKNYLQRSKLPAGRWDLMPWDVVGPYADMDARITLMLMLHQQRTIHEHKDREKIIEFVDRRLETMKVLCRMEWRGLPYDEIGSRDAAVECLKRAQVVAKKLPFGPTSDKAKKFFFTDKVSDRGVEGINMVPYSVTEKGAPSLTAEIIDRMVNDGTPYAEEWAEYRKVTNASSMWYEAYADRMGTDGRLRTCYRQNGTTSSRFSVERINLQAIPQDYRLENHKALAGIPTPRQFIASAVAKMPGWKIYELDLAQAELRVAAMFAGCESMLQMIENGEDLHAVTTRQLFNMDEGHPDWGQYRQVGKRGNFSLIFGVGWLTFQQTIRKETGIVLKDYEAQDIVVKWKRLYPEFGHAIDSHANRVARRQARYGYGWLTLLNGERRTFGKMEETHKAFNQRVQGNLAQFGIDWMLESDAHLRTAGFDSTPIGGAGLILTIHDSQVLLLPDDSRGVGYAADCANFGQELWGQTFPGVPGGVDYHAW